VVTDPGAPTDTTAERLLEVLREATGRPDLGYDGPPTPLSGGFFAEMLRFRLADPPAGLAGDLVARLVPSQAVGEREATVQGAVAEQGFPTPAVRMTAPESSALGRFLIVMDALDGAPPLAGLDPRTVAGQIPDLVRHLPDQLARIAAHLHSLDPEPLVARLESLDGEIPTTTAAFVEQQSTLARSIGRGELATAGERLLADQPRSTAHVITHGDLHPFNLLVTPDGPWLIDWTVSGVGHPGFTIAFTQLTLAHPPIPLPRVGRVVLDALGRRMARRFLDTYRGLTAGTPAEVDEAQLAWHRGVHALRILVELAVWDHAGIRPSAGHPWFLLEPVARRELGLPAARRGSVQPS